MYRPLQYLTIIACAISATFFLSCSKKDQRIENVENLLEKQQVDSAKSELSQFNISDLSDKQRAYYNLLKVRIDYINYEPIVSDTLINYSLQYFAKEGPVDKYTDALFYKAVYAFDEGKVKDAFTYMKKAEYNIPKITDIDLKHRIYETLTDWNMSYEEFPIALQYAKTNLKYSSMSGNPNWMAYSCAFLSQIYKSMGRKDSASLYLGKCAYYIKYVSRKEKIAFYNYLAYYFVTSDLGRAKEFLSESMKIGKESFTYAIACQIYDAEGNLAEAERNAQTALKLARTDKDREYIYNLMVRMYSDNKLYEKAYLASSELMNVKDRLAAKSKQYNIAGIQKMYDVDMQEKHFRDIITYTVFGIVFLLLLNVAVYIYIKNKYNKASKESLENQLLINIYNNKINELKTSNNAKESKVEMLNSKISELHDKQSKILFEGKNLYEKVINGGTVVTWSKSDFIHFIEYYKLLDLPFVSSLEHDYDSISPRYQFFETLYHMGKDDKEVERILGISHNTVRSTRTRIKSKKLVED
jgi:hypothetical protein